jgi:SPP1 family predicted phage head-tail adaptor
VKGGKLRKRVQYQESTDTVDDNGQLLRAWNTVYTCWGEIRALTGREAMTATQLKGTVLHTVTIRYQGSMPTPLGRLLYGARIFNITSVLNPDERNRQVDLGVTEVISPVTP